MKTTHSALICTPGVMGIRGDLDGVPDKLGTCDLYARRHGD